LALYKTPFPFRAHHEKNTLIFKAPEHKRPASTELIEVPGFSIASQLINIPSSSMA